MMFFALMTGVTAASAQLSSGDFFEGLSRKIGFSRMIVPHGLEITYDKTVHVIFPSPIKYVDLGSTNLIAGKADAAENVIRVKAAKKHSISIFMSFRVCRKGNETAYKTYRFPLKGCLLRRLTGLRSHLPQKSYVSHVVSC